MSAGAGDLWRELSSISHLAGACANATVSATLWRQRARFGPAANAVIVALAMTALWCLAAAAAGPLSPPAAWALALRNLAWLWALYGLFSSDGRHTSLAAVQPVLVALGLVFALQPLILTIDTRVGQAAAEGTSGSARLLFHASVMLGMLGVVGALVLVHNLYVGANGAVRRMLRWPALALGLVWIFELNLYTVAWLGNGWPEQLAACGGVMAVGFALLLAVAALDRQEQLRLRPSRAVAFRSISLLAILGYFLAMVVVAQWLADAGGDYARWLQFGFLIVAIALALVMLPSRRLRGWLRVTLTKHFFQHRYDYRAEWQRFTRTVGRVDDSVPFEQRAIQALADITDSPGGLLLLPGEEGDLILAQRWQWLIEAPARAYPAAGITFLERHDYILELDHEAESDARAERERPPVPAWLAEDLRAWALVPLLHHERLIGAVVLARPAQPRRLDWEDFDLLRVAGQQLATHLAEHAGQQALAEAGRFDDFHRRIAFVMHDIKNLASQFSLLARNAERHAENPEFRADMLVTLRASADRLNALIQRLSRYGSGAVEKIEPVAVGAVAREVAARWEGRHRIEVIERGAPNAGAGTAGVTIAGNRHSLEQVLAHLVQNAVDASPPKAPVFLDVGPEEPWARIEILDSGHGMSPEFLRARLFRPFDSTKAGGFGIGAYEARELVRAMHGRLEVESREGLGTRFVIRLPLAALSGPLSLQGKSSEVNPETPKVA